MSTAVWEWTNERCNVGYGKTCSLQVCLIFFFSLRVCCSFRLLVTEISMICTCKFLVYNALKISHLSAENFNH